VAVEAYPVEEVGEDSKEEWDEEEDSEIEGMIMEEIEIIIIEIEAEEEVGAVTEAGKENEVGTEKEKEKGEEIEGIEGTEIGTEIDIGKEIETEAIEIEVTETGTEVIETGTEVIETGKEVIEEIGVIEKEWTEKGIEEIEETEVRETGAEKEDICIWTEMIEIKYNILKIDIIGLYL
jgi:hypothetical protein